MIINFSDKPVIHSDKSIFLAGPTLRNSSYDNSWRKNSCEYLKSKGFDGVVYVPEFSCGDNPVNLNSQFKWEREALMNSSVILFNLCRTFPELPGFTTNVEFGTYTSKKPESLVICSPEGAKRNGYLELLYIEEYPDGVIYKDIFEALDVAFEKVNEVKINV